MSGPGGPRPDVVLARGRRLTAFVHLAGPNPRGAAVVCHPHPAHGGHMDHPVVVLTAERAAAAGLVALRFDFGGVRESEGDADDARAHLDEVRRAAAHVRALQPRGPLYGAGFSYGARALARLAAGGPSGEAPLDVAGLVLLAPATRVPRSARDFGRLLLGRPLETAARDERSLDALAQVPVPVRVIVGERDVVAPREDLEPALPPGARMETLPGLNHFFAHGPGAGATDVSLLAPALDRAWSALLDAR